MVRAGNCPELRPRDLSGEIVLEGAFAVDVCSGAVNAAAKRVGVPKRHREHLEAELVQLIALVDFARFHANRLVIKHEAVH